LAANNESIYGAVFLLKSIGSWLSLSLPIELCFEIRSCRMFPTSNSSSVIVIGGFFCELPD